MKAKEILEILEHIVHSGLAEVEIETDDFRINVKRESGKWVAVPPPDTTALAPARPAVQVETPAQTSDPLPAPAPAAPVEELIPIRSPMIGTFYRAANPEVPPFVEVGQRVEKGKTVCIVEAMKLFNEIESEVSGTVVKALVENATPVEYDQVLFLVKPD
ncbi:MAG: acetyl-CoA carboxylase biotin carboxyl carrier protein [Bernardetiaceae bacterium]